MSFVEEAVAEAVEALVSSPSHSPAATKAKLVSTGLKKLATRAGTPHASKADLDEIISDIASAVKRIALADDDEEEEEEEEEEDASKPSTPVIAPMAPKSSSKSGADRKKVAMRLVGDAVQSALACIATAADAEETDSGCSQVVELPMPASVRKSGTPQREAFVDLVQNLTTAVSGAIETGTCVEEEQKQGAEKERVHSAAKSLSKTTKKRRSLAGHFVASAMQSAFDALTVDLASPAPAPAPSQSAPSPAVLAVKSVQKEALVSLVESMAQAVEVASEAAETEESAATEPLVAKVATPVQPKSTAKRPKLSARKSQPAKKDTAGTPVKSPVVVPKTSSATSSATKHSVTTAKKESPAKTPVKKSAGKRTKTMKSPLPSKNSPSAALPSKRAKISEQEQKQKQNSPVPLTGSTRPTRRKPAPPLRSCQGRQWQERQGKGGSGNRGGGSRRGGRSHRHSVRRVRCRALHR